MFLQQKLQYSKKEIRKTLHNDEWWFVIEDVVFALTDSSQPKGYVKDMRRRDKKLAKGWMQIATPLSISTQGGVQKLNCASTEGIFRIIQSIPLPNAEPFKRWLAKADYERVKEIEDPELATKRTRALYKAKDYSDDWIEKRMRGIEIRETLIESTIKGSLNIDSVAESLNKQISCITQDFSKTDNDYTLSDSTINKIKAYVKYYDF